MAQFQLEHLRNIESGIKLFNEQKYWECHEELEHWWLEAVGDPVRYIYWAVIQVAAALIHYREGRLEGATGLIQKAKDKLIKCEELKVESPLLQEYLSWNEFKNLVRKVPNKPQLEDFEELFSFRFEKFNE